MGWSTSRALAASQLATSIAESRYFASRYAAEGEARMIASAFATLDQARSEIDATIALDGGGSQSREQLEAFRGFGGPQGMVGIERAMDRVEEALGKLTGARRGD